MFRGTKLRPIRKTVFSRHVCSRRFMVPAPASKSNWSKQYDPSTQNTPCVSWNPDRCCVDHASGSEQDYHSERTVWIQHWRRLCAGQLHAVRSVPEETWTTVGPAHGSTHRKIFRRPNDVCGDHHIAGKPEKTGPLQGHCLLFVVG